MCAVLAAWLVAVWPGVGRGLVARAAAGCPAPSLYHAGLLDSVTVDASSSQLVEGNAALAAGTTYLLVVCGSESFTDALGNSSEFDGVYCVSGAACASPAAGSTLWFGTGPPIPGPGDARTIPRYSSAHVYQVYLVPRIGGVWEAENRLLGGSASGTFTIDLYSAQLPPASSASQIAAAVNAQRQGNLIPAGITVDQTLTEGCAGYDSYMQLNGTFGGGETPGRPGYTALGAQIAKEGTVIDNDGPSVGAGAGGVGFPGWNLGNPFESAPNHLAALLAPRLDVIGGDDDQDPAAGQEWICVSTGEGYTRPAPATYTVYTYPGDGAYIYPDETAYELPATPGQSVGIAPDTVTGPYLIVFADGPFAAGAHAHIQSARLTGPGGPVAVKTVDHAGGWSGGFVIPLPTLTSGARYDARVTLQVNGVTLVHTWSFTAQAARDVFDLNSDVAYPATGASGPGVTVVTRAPAGPAKPIAALLGHPSVRRQRVLISLSCASPPCVLGVSETTVEQLSPVGGRILAVQADSRRQRRVVVGTLRLTTHTRRTTLTIALNKLGRKLLKQFGELPLKLTLTASTPRRKATNIATLILALT